MNTTVVVNTSLFTAMCHDLSRRLTIPPEEALREETSKIFEKAAANTAVASVSKIKSHSQRSKFFLAPIGFAGRGASRRVLYNLSRHYPNALWNAIQLARAKDVRIRIEARGLAKRSWYELALLLGLPIAVPAYVRKAIATTKKIYPQDYTTRVTKGNGEIVFYFENSQPTVNAIGGAQALQQAIDGRVAFFVMNVKKDVFTSLAAVAKKYPGVTVNP